MLADLTFVAGFIVVVGWIALWAIELTRPGEVRFLPRWTWALLCIFCIPVGAIAYLIVSQAWDHPHSRLLRH